MNLAIPSFSLNNPSNFLFAQKTFCFLSVYSKKPPPSLIYALLRPSPTSTSPPHSSKTVLKKLNTQTKNNG